MKGTDDAGEISVRVLFDGTFGVPAYDRIKVRDQDCCPVAVDIKRALREQAAYSAANFGLTANVKEAHRLIAVNEQDWKFLGCRAVMGGDVFINKVGTFGIASAAYWR